ncbi:MAG: sulfatase [Pirellulaceae bacterium]|nr:sulfatase [Pirellulaceae bacterium]
MPRINSPLFLVVIAVTLVNPISLSAAEPRTRTNIVLILADDLGHGDLGSFGHPKFQTPRLDGLAAEGARLTNFYASCPFCAPTRASLLTGRYPFRSGMNGNPAPDGGVNDLGLPDSEVTLAEALRAAGYATACIGKWHLGHQPRFFPTRHGFDEYFGILYSNDMRPVELRENEAAFEYPVVQATLTERYTERAAAFIEKNRDRPFFLYLPHAMPHKPLAASDKFYKQSGNGLYADVLAELDAGIGRVLDKLAECKLEERTLVLFSSDNGPWYGGSTGGLRGMKGQNWEGGIRVPLIARWPGRIPPGHVSHEPAIMMDLFATALAATGAPLPAERTIDGRNILPLLSSAAKSPHEALFSVQGKNLSTIRMGNWKLHPAGTPKPDTRGADWVDPRAPDGTTILAPVEQARPTAFPGLLTGDTASGPALFDLATDPGEQRNVAADHPAIVARLRAKFEQVRAEMGK